MRKTPLELVRNAWNCLPTDLARAKRLADEAKALAKPAHSSESAWTELMLGLCQMFEGDGSEASKRLAAAASRFSAIGDRHGYALARSAEARNLWFRGDFAYGAAVFEAVRELGGALLRGQERAFFLNVAAGFHSTFGDSRSAFRLLQEALAHQSGVGGQRAALECNISHELLEVGAWDAALAHIDRALRDPQVAQSTRLGSVLRINRVLCLVEKGVAREGMQDVDWLVRANAPNRQFDAYSDTYAVIALCAIDAGDTDLARKLSAEPALHPTSERPDAKVYHALIQAKLARASGQTERAIAVTNTAFAALERSPVVGLTLRVAQMLYRLGAEVQEDAGNLAAALSLTRKSLALTAERAARFAKTGLIDLACETTAAQDSVQFSFPGPSFGSDPSVSSRLQSPLGPRSRLTPSLARTLVHLRQGMSNKAIAKALKISDFTVRDHCSELYRVFGVRTRNELIVKLGQQQAV